jgi:hypothetical protein
MNRSWNTRLALPASLAFALVAPAAASAQQQQQKPNILVIMADDIGYWNISAYIAEIAKNSWRGDGKAPDLPATQEHDFRSVAFSPQPAGCRGYGTIRSS